MNWIRVEDRLPEKNIDVIIFCGDVILIDKITYPKDNNIWACTSKKYITHWMPLPEVPDEHI